MSSQAFRLMYPHHLVNEPIINNLLREYTFKLNILQASITPESGWIDVQLSGKAAEIDNAITWLKTEGVEILLLAK